MIDRRRTPQMSAPTPATRNAPTWLTILLGVLGIVCVVVGIVYLAEPAHSLPSFFPGHTAHGTKPRTKHGVAAIVVGVILLLGAWLTTGKRRSA
jgi:NADH:ubiquinone oxidoreductase subunit 5 (subunit L)/multisubunit Na+/H+ antiporter MnhA subunit